MSIDEEQFKKYFSMFKVSAIILGLAIVVAIVLLLITIPQAGNYFKNKKALKETLATISEKETELARIKDDQAREEAERLPDNEMKIFYKDINKTGSLTSDILAGEVQEINNLIKYYGIKIYKVNYLYDDENDAFFKGKKEKYGVCKMELELFSNYMKFQGFLKDLYKHEHFLNIQSIEVNPYKKDKSILNIKLVLSLYAEKDGSEAPVPMNDNSPMSNDEMPAEGSMDAEELNLEI